MKLYRVHHTVDAGASAGYSWYTSRREAEAVVRRQPADRPATIDSVEVKLSRAGILSFANRYAGYPDNG